MNNRNGSNDGFWDGDEKTAKNECAPKSRIAPKLSAEAATQRMPQWLRNARGEQTENTPSTDEYWG